MPTFDNSSKQEHEKAIWVIVALVILVATFGAVFFKQIRDLVAPESNVNPPAGGGKVAFVVTQPNETFPRFSEVEFAPYAVAAGEDITFRILVDDPDGIATVTAEVQGTGDIVELKYQEAVGEIEIWEGTWPDARELTPDYNPVLFTSTSNSGAVEAFTGFFKTDPGNINDQIVEQIIADNPTLTEEEKQQLRESLTIPDFNALPELDPNTPPLTDSEIQDILEQLRQNPNFTEEDIAQIEQDLTTPFDELTNPEN